MKKLLLALILCSAWSFAADLTSNTNTLNNQIYNTGYRDIKDGTNAPTFDIVTADTYTVVSVTTTIKATGGYLESIYVANLSPTGCGLIFPVQVFDGITATGTNFLVKVGTTAVTGNFAVPVKARFATGLTVGIDASCSNPIAVSVSFR